MAAFPEEPLDSSIGYFPVHPHQKLHSGRYTIVRKLGWGPRSSAWLGLDSQDAQYWAIKILTAHATDDKSLAATKERELLRGPIADSGLKFPKLINSFLEVDTIGKRHLCLVLDVLGHSVEDIRRTSPNGALPLHYVQKVVGDVAEALTSLSNRGIKHGGVHSSLSEQASGSWVSSTWTYRKPSLAAVTVDNLLFFVGSTPEAVREQLARAPTKKPYNVVGSDGRIYEAWKSQPFENGFRWDTSASGIMYAHLHLNNFGHASQVALPGSDFPQRNYLPPEVFQGTKVDAKADIWMLGCTTYFLLTGTPLFSESYTKSPVKVATQTIAQLEKLLAESGNVPHKAIPSTAAFLRACLTVSPRRRVDPEEIYDGGWTRTSDCSCGWSADKDPSLPL